MKIVNKVDFNACICSPGILLGDGLLALFLAADFAAGAGVNTSIAALFFVDRIIKRRRVVLPFDTCCCSQPHLPHDTELLNLTESKTETRTCTMEDEDNLPAEAKDTEEERSSPKPATTATQEDEQLPVESLEQSSQDGEAKDEVQPHVELTDVPLNGSDSASEQADKDASTAKNESKSAQNEGAVNGSDRLSPTMEDGQLSPASVQAKYDLLSKAGIVLEGSEGVEEDLEKYSEALMTSEAVNEEEGQKEEEETSEDTEKEKGATLKRVRFADQVSERSPTEVAADESEAASLPSNKQLQQEQLIEKEEEV